MLDWLKRKRSARTLERRAIPDPLWRLTLARFPFLAARSVEDIAQLRDMATLFLAEKEFTGVDGLEVDEERPLRQDPHDRERLRARGAIERLEHLVARAGPPESPVEDLARAIGRHSCDGIETQKSGRIAPDADQEFERRQPVQSQMGGRGVRDFRREAMPDRTHVEIDAFHRAGGASSLHSASR